MRCARAAISSAELVDSSLTVACRTPASTRFLISTSVLKHTLIGPNPTEDPNSITRCKLVIRVCVRVCDVE